MSRSNRYSPDNLPRPAHWRDEAVCREEEPELFYAEGAVDIEEAKSHCRRCPVKAECLAGALERREPFGVWGALSATERRAILAPTIKAERAAAKAAKEAKAAAKEAADAARAAQAEEAARVTAALIDVRPRAEEVTSGELASAAA